MIQQLLERVNHLELALEIGLAVLWVVFGFILGWFTNWHFYKKQRKENEAAMEILRQLNGYKDAEIRLGNDKRGKIIKNPDGTIGIAFTQVISDAMSISESAVKQKKSEN